VFDVRQGEAVPRCVHRNGERYEFMSSSSRVDVGISGAKGYSAYCKEFVLEYPVSSSVLQSTIVEDASASKTQRLPRYSTLTLCKSGSDARSSVIHGGGKYMDQLIIRDLDSMTEAPSLAAFSLSLGRGEPIVEVHPAGKSNWGNRAHLLARTRAEIFHVATTRVAQLAPKTRVNAAESKQPMDSVILEPLKKWQLPSEILSLTTSPHASESLGCVLASSGQLFTWNLSQGVLPYSSAEKLFPQWPTHLTSLACDPQVCYSSWHQMVVYAALGPDVLCIDLRTSGKKAACAVPSNTLSSSSQTISGLCQHKKDGNFIFVACADGTNSVSDLRFPKQCVAERCVQTKDFHESLQFSPLEDTDGLLFGRSSRSRHVHLHSIGLSRHNPHPLSRFLSSYQPASVATCCWDSTVFPFVDQASPHASLWGAALVPITPCRPAPADKEEQYPTFQFTMLQQSSLGDIFVQEIHVQERRPVHTSPLFQPDLPCGLAYASTSAKQFIQKKRGGDSDDDDQDEKRQKQQIGPRQKRGLVMAAERRSLMKSDNKASVYPIPSGAFVPVRGQGDTMSRAASSVSGVLGSTPALNPSGTMSDADQYDATILFIESKGLLNECLVAMERAPMTLWEVWKYALDRSSVDLDAWVLRRYLRNMHDIEERPLPPIAPLQPLTVDGLRVFPTDDVPICSCTNVAVPASKRDDCPRQPCPANRHCIAMHSLLYSKSATEEGEESDKW
jgi:WD40 repeat protein